MMTSKRSFFGMKTETDKLIEIKKNRKDLLHNKHIGMLQRISKFFPCLSLVNLVL